MNRRKLWTDKSGVSCYPCRNHEEPQPKPDLAYTPTDMARMHAAGMPVNSANLINSFCDGSENPSFDLPIDRKRGVDITDVWEQSMAAKDKVKKLGKSIKKSQTNQT